MSRMATCVTAPSCCSPPFHLTQIDGPSSSRAIYLSKPTEPVKQPQRTWPHGLVTASLQKPDLLEYLEWLYSWKEKSGEKDAMKRGWANKKSSSSSSLSSLSLWISLSPPLYLLFFPPLSQFNPISISLWTFWECLVLLHHLCCSSKRQGVNYPVHDT